MYLKIDTRIASNTLTLQRKLNKSDLQHEESHTGATEPIASQSLKHLLLKKRLRRAKMKPYVGSVPLQLVQLIWKEIEPSSASNRP